MDKKKAMIALGYFKFFSEDQIQVACKLSSIRRFEPLDTIYKQDRGQLSNVHFVLSGECMILQCLKMEIHEKAEKTVLRLVDVLRDTPGAKEKDISDVETKSLLQRINTNLRKTNSLDHRLAKSDEEQLPSLESESFAYGWMPASDISLTFEDTEDSYSEKCEQGKNIFDDGHSKFPKVMESQETLSDKSKEETKLSVFCKPGVYANQEIMHMKSSYMSESHLHHEKHIHRKGSTDRSVNRFIDVGTYNKFGIFGLGEQLEDRAIIARTRVLCLVVPRYWLLQKEQNPGNIWNRRRFTLNAAVPSRQSLFNNYLQEIRWNEYKKNYIKSILETSSGFNSTKPEDIPILCRILEGQAMN